MTSAPRPSSANYAAFFAAWYFDGHLVIMLPGWPTKTPSRTVPCREISRPPLNWSGGASR